MNQTDPSSSQRDFVQRANPHAWLLVADSLHEQAKTLKANVGGRIAFRNFVDGGTQSWDVSNRAVFLLGGFALENILKGLLVYENPSWVSNGRLSRKLRSHSLSRLRDASTLAPYRTRYRWVLKEFERGLESWARYPCALSATGTEDQQMLAARTWRGYQYLMNGYGRTLIKLLSKGWQGPHGYYARFTFDGEFLSVVS